MPNPGVVLFFDCNITNETVLVSLTLSRCILCRQCHKSIRHYRIGYYVCGCEGTFLINHLIMCLLMTMIDWDTSNSVYDIAYFSSTTAPVTSAVVEMSRVQSVHAVHRRTCFENQTCSTKTCSTELSIAKYLKVSSEPARFLSCAYWIFGGVGTRCEEQRPARKEFRGW